MTATILNCKEMAQQIKQEVKNEIEKFKLYPTLWVYQIGNDEPSNIYINKKKQACKEVGIKVVHQQSLDSIAENAVIEIIERHNEFDGILVQLPLPKHISKFRVFDVIPKEKDVDCFNPVNTGLVVQDRPYLIPCTPQGIIEILRRSGLTPFGKRVTIVGRSLIVGQPLASMLIQDNEFANATVTVVHEHTKDLPDIIKNSDIVISAVGKRDRFILNGEWLKSGAIVIDVGITKDKITGRIYGDVDFESASRVAGYISKVPGGVGLLTVACLLKNTLIAAKYQKGLI